VPCFPTAKKLAVRGTERHPSVIGCRWCCRSIPTKVTMSLHLRIDSTC